MRNKKSCEVVITVSRFVFYGGNMGFKFYFIEDKYVRFLRSGDRKVQFNKNHSRPYVGIVLQINDIDYYVPLESPKPNHTSIKSGGPVLKLDNGDLGIMGFNNMLPVPEEALIGFDINVIPNSKYKNLLRNQLRYCNKNKNLIIRRAHTTYRKATFDKEPFYLKICCNYAHLESMSMKYDPAYKSKKKG